MDGSSTNNSGEDTTAITETITESNIDDIVESQYNNDEELIGYSCKQLLETNTVEPMDLVFYMDILSPKDDNETLLTTATRNNQQKAIDESQSAILKEVSEEYQIDPIVSKGVRCFDLPVDGSTWLVQISIESKDFSEVTLFGGCRELEWDDATQDCKFYEARLKGSYMGAIRTDKDGTKFSDVVEVVKTLINGPVIADNLDGYYQTSFLGVPRTEENPNFQAGSTQEGRDVLKQPVNIKTGIEINQNAAGNRRTITVVGGTLVACFSIAFLMVGYLLVKRRRSYRESRAEADLAAANGDPSMAVGAGGYNLDKGSGKDETNIDDDDDDDADEYDYDGDVDAYNYGDLESSNNDHEESDGQTSDSDLFEEDDPHSQQRQLEATQGEYPDLPMSAEAIQMDLGNTFKSQLMDVHGNSSKKCGPLGAGSPIKQHKRLKGSSGAYFHQLHDDGDNESNDDADSWAQTDGTIGSLELQLEPITAEV